MTHPAPDPTLAAQAALAPVLTEWLDRHGVVSVAVARRWSEGAPTDEVGIRVTVERLLPPEQVPDGELFPSEVDGVPVDLVEGSPPHPEALG
ncbi:MAG: hypothetical protein R8G01_20320 [Ilumatobacteraceae bacterium]|nr:hypothetical protein [Ilumatobacteraceae bacterium]